MELYDAFSNLVGLNFLFNKWRGPDFKTDYDEHADRYGVEGTLRHSIKQIRRIVYHIRRIIPNKGCQLNGYTYLSFVGV